MVVRRFGLRAFFEWAVAAACIAVVAGIGTRSVQELRGVDALPAVIADERAIPEPPASMFPGAVYVPLLLLSTGDQLRVGEYASTIADRLHDAWQIGSDALERSDYGHRTVRRYDDGATQFAVVLEAIGDEEERVVGIYLR